MTGRALALARHLRAAYVRTKETCVQSLRLQTLRQSSAPDMQPAARRFPFAMVAGLALAGALLIAASMLWASYGTAVFFETIAAGIAACF